jgi:hypothetical protein
MAENDEEEKLYRKVTETKENLELNNLRLQRDILILKKKEQEHRVKYYTSSKTHNNNKVIAVVFILSAAIFILSWLPGL